MYSSMMLAKGTSNNNGLHLESQAPQVKKSSKLENRKLALVKSLGNIVGSVVAINVGKPTWQLMKWDGSIWREDDRETNTGCPSKFLVMCLNTVQEGVLGADVDMPLFGSMWGLEFWSSYTNGSDLVDADDGGHKMVEKIAWVVSAAADTISMKEKEGMSFDGPFLLYIVSSVEKVYEVCQICKCLEVVGIQTLDLHSDASIDHQIHSLKSYEPEFIVSTHERLLELLSLKAVDLSDVSLMVVDGVEPPVKGTAYLNAVESIRQTITGKPQMVVFCGSK